jgi:hypothetical protein
MNSLASSTGTPWAAYDAGFYAAQAADVTAVRGASAVGGVDEVLEPGGELGRIACRP